uniref:Reverse transcriptase domain-containing protein n=1 Tax=Cannabis sativa TaxID=3483 RepID=A0A803PR65_CANSA
MEELLVGLNFPSKFVNWIMMCLKGTSYTIMLNGRLHGKFQGKKGLRQGDLMSPLLSFLTMEYLSRRLKKETTKTIFRFHPMCKGLNLVSLCFADDLILFSKGSPMGVHHLKIALESFSEVTGLFPNKYKSLVYFGGVSTGDKMVILEDLHMGEGTFPLKYLGVPLRPTKWRREDCETIIKKVKLRLETWATRYLSYAGRVQLIHSILFGLRNYWMSIFILPQSVIKEVEKLCRGFLWGFKGEKSKIHLAFWDLVCLPKPFGGLGFKNGPTWNRSILGKFIWAIMDKHDILWVKWVNNIYMKGVDFWEYELKGDVSWYWRKMCHLRKRYTRLNVLAAVKKGKFIAARLYMGTIQRSIDNFYKSVWCNVSLPKHRFIMWQVVHGNLLTKDNFAKFHIALESCICPVCGMEEESHSHIFFNCRLSKEVLQLVFSWCGAELWPSDFTRWKVWLANSKASVRIHLAAATVYMVWKNRNSCVDNNCCYTKLRIVNSIKESQV